MVSKHISLLAGLTTVLAQSASSSACQDHVIIATRGTFEKQGPSIGFTDMISWTLGNVTGGVEYDTVYPAAQDQTYYLGADDIVRYIDAGVQSCPSQKYVLLGYSQGASATGAALQNYTDVNSAGYKAIAAVLVIGNPYKIPNKSNDVDNLGGSSNRQYRGSFYNASLPDEYGNGVPEVFYTNNKFIDICYQNDPVCAPQSPAATLDAHVLYGGSLAVQNMGARFLINKLGGPTSNGTNGTSPTTSPSIASSIPVSTSTPTSTASSTSSTSSSTSAPSSGLATAIQLPALWTTLGLALVSVFFA